MRCVLIGPMVRCTEERQHIALMEGTVGEDRGRKPRRDRGRKLRYGSYKRITSKGGGNAKTCAKKADATPQPKYTERQDKFAPSTSKGGGGLRHALGARVALKRGAVVRYLFDGPQSLWVPTTTYD